MKPVFDTIDIVVADVAASIEFYRLLGLKITSHVHLMPQHTATTVRLDGAEPVITDWPFVESKEIISRVRRSRCAGP